MRVVSCMKLGGPAMTAEIAILIIDAEYAAAFYMNVAWACEAPNTSASQAVSTNKAMCFSNHLRKDGGVKLARKFIDYFCKKNSKEIITVRIGCFKRV